MRVRVALPLLFALAALGGGRAARAQGNASDLLGKARTEMAKLDFEAAITLLELAEATGQNQPAHMAEIYRALAEAHAAMGRTDAAETAFRRLLALDPSVELPAGSSPKLTGPFTAAREFLAKRRVAIECRRNAADAATLVVQSDPVDLVAGARLVTADAGPVGDIANGQGRIPLTIPGGTAPTGCTALDRHGNALVRADLAREPEVESPAGGGGGASARTGPITSSGPVDSGGRPIYARWWLYGAIGAAAGGVAVYYGLKMKQAEDDLVELNRRIQPGVEPDHDITYPDWLEVADRGKGYARNANIAFVVTGVFAAVSGGLLIHQLVTDDDSGDSAETEPAIGAGPLPGGAAVNLTLGF